MTAPLQPVSMKKGKPAPLPRLSPRRVPDAERSDRFWRPEEDQIMRAYYPKGGAAACMLKLPDRTISAIRQRVTVLGLKYTGAQTGGVSRFKGTMTPELEMQIRDAWPGLTGRGDVIELARRLSVPRHWLRAQAMKLGLTMTLKQKSPPWSEAENALMRNVPLHDPVRCARIFASKGFKRSATAIVVRAQRLDLSRRYDGGLSAGKAAAILGVDSKFITTRCLSGVIPATRRGSRRLPQQGGDSWEIDRADLRRWIVDNLEQIDIRKVEKFSFVALLADHRDTPS